MKKFVLSLFLIIALTLLVFDFVSLPALAADSASCKSGSCKCSCKGAECKCEASGGSCTCDCVVGGGAECMVE